MTKDLDPNVVPLRTAHTPLSPPECDVSSGDAPEVSPGLDPYMMAKNWPGVWNRIIRTGFRDMLDVQLTFGVSERTARDWWNGKTGANGAHVWVAIMRYPPALEILRDAA